MTAGFLTNQHGDGDVTVYGDDCLAVLRAGATLGYDWTLGYEPDRLIPDASIDTVITDPPYGLGFMAQAWDRPGSAARGYKTDADLNGNAYGRARAEYGGAAYGMDQAQHMRAFQAWCEQWAAECLRVLKPGGHLLAFGGTRTYHRLGCAIEDAGFEIRDSCLDVNGHPVHDCHQPDCDQLLGVPGAAWIYGSGFPKSMNVSAAIDRHTGRPTEIVGVSLPDPDVIARFDQLLPGVEVTVEPWLVEQPAPQPAVTEWQGWGTALKPAFEPIVVGRKPLAGTVAANVLAHGTGALNIDVCRVPHADDADRAESEGKNRHAQFGTEPGGNNVYGDFSQTPVRDYDGSRGRWPTNVLLNADTAAPALDEQAGVRQPGNTPGRRAGLGYGSTSQGTAGDRVRHGGGGASRYFPTFRYEPKAPAAERPTDDGMVHPTVKPLELVRWLVRLVTPPGGLVLDPFLGSGTTAEACLLEGARCVGMEREVGYLRLIDARLAKPMQPSLFQ